MCLEAVLVLRHASLKPVYLRFSARCRATADETRLEMPLPFPFREPVRSSLGRNCERNFTHALAGQGLTAVNEWTFSLWK